MLFFGRTLMAEEESPLDLVVLADIIPTLVIELPYATPNNITGKTLYYPGFKARLRRGVALELKAAQETLQPMGYRLKVWDAWRPMSAQKALYAVISDPRYVAEPGEAAMHNRGVAVDVTLVDAEGRELTMPTGFDVMTREAHYHYRGKDPVIAKNLALLQKVMKENGFYACRTEWWHFFSRKWRAYPIMDIE